MAFGADRTVKVNLKATVSDYVGKMSAAGKATKDFSRDAVKSAEQHRQSWDKVGKGMVVSGLAIGAAVAGAVKAYADFDQQMSQVRAVSNASAGDMAKLTQAARDAGKGTKFSATEAAQATTELAKVGLSTSDILGGALTGSLNLAAAGNLSLADAAEISGQTMKTFNLAGKDVGRIADALANGANKSAADVESLSQGLKQGGLVASQFGLTMEDTVGTLSLFADNALVGSDAGTSLKTMLLRLNPTTDAAASAMRKIGLRAYDAQGNFVGLESIAGQLKSGLSGLSAEQQNTTLQTIFGQDAIRAANVLYKEGAAGLHEYVQAVKESGAAARVAAINQDNLAGDFEKLKGSISDLAIGMGEAGNGPLRDFVRSLTSMVDSVGELPKPVQTAVFWTAALGSAALITGGSLLVLIPKIAATRAAMVELGISGSVTSKVLKGLGAAAAVVGVAVLADEVSKFAPGARAATVNADKLADSLGRVAEGAKGAGELGRLFAGHGLFGDKIKTSAEALDKFADSAQIALGANLTDKIDRMGLFGNATDKFSKQVDQIDSALAQMVKNGNADQASAAYDKLMASITKANKAGANIPVDEIAAKFKNYQAAIDGANESQKSGASATEEYGSNLDRVKAAAEDAATALQDYIKGLQDAGLKVLDVRQATRDYKDALADASKAVKKNGETLSINTAKGRDNQKALDDLSKAALNQADAIFKNTGSEAKYRESLVKSRADLVKTGQRFGLTKAQAEAYADSVLKIPPAKHTNVTINAAAAKAQVDSIQRRINALRGNDIRINVRYVENGPRPGGGTNTGGGQTKNAATGGYISGAGSATSDSIPAYLSNGEYVVKAAAVAKYGKTFFDHVNGMRFASGGFVSRTQAAGQPSGGATYAPTFNVQGADAYGAVQQAMREWEYRMVNSL